MTNRHYHGTRVELAIGDLVGRENAPVTANLDEAIWAAELADGDAPPRVYVVAGEPLRVVGEVTEWLHYHGTRAQLRPGDLIEPGRVSNFGATARKANYVYFTRRLDAAAWGAELAAGDGPGHIYIVEPTGPVEDDPNLTNRKFRGNPTKSFRSRAPLRITGEVTDWKGHSPEAIQTMKEGLERLKQLGVDADD